MRSTDSHGSSCEPEHLAGGEDLAQRDAAGRGRRHRDDLVAAVVEHDRLALDRACSRPGRRRSTGRPSSAPRRPSSWPAGRGRTALAPPSAIASRVAASAGWVQRVAGARAALPSGLRMMRERLVAARRSGPGSSPVGRRLELASVLVDLVGGAQSRSSAWKLIERVAVARQRDRRHRRGPSTAASRTSRAPSRSRRRCPGCRRRAGRAGCPRSGCRPCRGTCRGWPCRARSRGSRCAVDRPSGKRTTMKPPPPMLPAVGWVTPSAKPTATAASTALPPFSSTAMPIAVACFSALVTAPRLPGGDVGGGCRRRLLTLLRAGCGLGRGLTAAAGDRRARRGRIGLARLRLAAAGEQGRESEGRERASDTGVEGVAETHGPERSRSRRPARHRPSPTGNGDPAHVHAEGSARALRGGLHRTAPIGCCHEIRRMHQAGRGVVLVVGVDEAERAQ